MFVLNVHNAHLVSIVLISGKKLECPIKNTKKKIKTNYLNKFFINLSLSVSDCTSETKNIKRKNKINVFNNDVSKKILNDFDLFGIGNRTTSKNKFCLQ